MIKYEVFVNSVHGSDVVVKYDRSEAIAAAIKWSKECPDEEVCVVRVTEVEDVSVTNGVVTDKSVESK